MGEGTTKGVSGWFKVLDQKKGIQQHQVFKCVPFHRSKSQTAFFNVTNSLFQRHKQPFSTAHRQLPH
jgi:hypothetical protein